MSLKLLTNFPFIALKPKSLYKPKKLYNLKFFQIRCFSISKRHLSYIEDAYKKMLESKEIKVDRNQQTVVKELGVFEQSLKDYKHVVQDDNAFSDFLSTYFGKAGSYFLNSKTPVEVIEKDKKYTCSPYGVYLYGGVGCGKTMLMDLLYESIPIEKKRRVHFHSFMLDVHKEIFAHKELTREKGFNLNRSRPYDPIGPVALEIAKKVTLLCFDEFQVTDIADAMILKRLFFHFWKNGIVIFSTSNRRPDDLYKNGLQRFHFLPFISLLKANCQVINLNSLDYRKIAVPADGCTFFSETECDTKYQMDVAYEQLVSRSDGVEGRKSIEVMGRTLTFEKTCGDILDVTFEELCVKPLGPVDYLEICRHFKVILLRNVPQLSLSQRGRAKRFITLIDTLYDHKVKVIFSAETPLDDLFIREKAKITEEDKLSMNVLMGDLDISEGDNNQSASLFTGEEELFAFERIMSRMMDMRSANYWTLENPYEEVEGGKLEKKKKKNK